MFSVRVPVFRHTEPIKSVQDRIEQFEISSPKILVEVSRRKYYIVDAGDLAKGYKVLGDLPLKSKVLPISQRRQTWRRIQADQGLRKFPDVAAFLAAQGAEFALIHRNSFVAELVPGS